MIHSPEDDTLKYVLILYKRPVRSICDSYRSIQIKS